MINSDRLRTSLNDIVQRTKWTSDREPSVDADGLRQVYKRTAFSSDLWFLRFNYRPQVPEVLVEELSVQLRLLFTRFMEPRQDRFGNGLFSVTGGDFKSMRHPQIVQYARDLAKPATILGVERVVELLQHWVRDGVIRIHRNAVLRGVTIDNDELRLEEGVHVWKLPSSTSELPLSCPGGISSNLGQCVLSFECELAPAFYKPTDYSIYTEPDLKPVPSLEPFKEFTLDSFCESLSLACNRYIDWEISWADLNRLGELQAFSRYMLNHVGKVSSLEPKPLESPDTIVLSQHRLDQAREIHLTRFASGKNRRELDLAIKWWLEYKGSRSYEDELIRLRISLEALYLKGIYQELGYRLATRGAWHVGSDYKARREYFSTLRKFYDLASGVIHASEKSKESDKNRNVTLKAGEVCRLGILKRLHEDREPKWNEIVLGMNDIES